MLARNLCLTLMEPLLTGFCRKIICCELKKEMSSWTHYFISAGASLADVNFLKIGGEAHLSTQTPSSTEDTYLSQLWLN